MTQYRVLVGIDYPPNKRAEIGDVVNDLPGGAIKDLLKDGFIEPVDGKKVSVKEEPVVEEAPVVEDPTPVAEEVPTIEEEATPIEAEVTE